MFNYNLIRLTGTLHEDDYTLFISHAQFYVHGSVHRKSVLYSPSGISELDCATTKTDTAERSISIGRESLQVFFCTRGLDVLPGPTARG